MASSKRATLIKGLYLEKQGNRCPLCGCTLKSQTAGAASVEAKKKIRAATWEHVVPVAKGGHNTLCNIILTCLPCNEARGNRMPTDAEWRTAEVIIWDVFKALVGYEPKGGRARVRTRAKLRLVVDNEDRRAS